MAKLYKTTINRCADCPHYWAPKMFDNVAVVFRCVEAEETIPDINVIPDWCPLPDKEEK